MSGIELTQLGGLVKGEDEGQVVHVRGLDGEPLYYETDKPVTVTVVGTYSTAYRTAMNRQRERVLKLRRAKLTGELVDEQQLELDAACVVAWDGFFIGGKPVACTPENVKKVLTEVPFIREQVEEAMNDHASFFRGKSVTS